jgi:hypothetical protein
MDFGGPTRTTKYYCPYCGKSQWLFSLKPLTTSAWACTKCRHPFLLDTKAVMHSWLNTVTFWSLLPLGLLLTVLFIAVTKADKLILALLIGVPVFTVALALVVYVCCIPLAWIVARRIVGKSGRGDRHLKTVVREVS